MAEFEMPNNNDLLVRARRGREERAVQNAALIVDAALHAFVQWDYGNKPSSKPYPWIAAGVVLAEHDALHAEVKRCLDGHPFRAHVVVEGGDAWLLKRIGAIAREAALEAYRIYGEPRTAWCKWHKVSGGDERWQTKDEWLLHGVRVCTGRAALIGGVACGTLLDYDVHPRFGDAALFAQVASCMGVSRGAESAYDLYRSARWPEEILPPLHEARWEIWQHWVVLHGVTHMIMAIDGVRIVAGPPSEDEDEPTRTERIREIWELAETEQRISISDCVVGSDQSRGCVWCSSPSGAPCVGPDGGHLSGIVHAVRTRDPR